MSESNAWASFDPSIGAATSAVHICPEEYFDDAGNPMVSDEDLAAILQQLADKVAAVRDGGTELGQEMLAAQAITLDQLFRVLIARGMASDTLSKLDTYLKLGLRAQSQTRSTFEAISLLKNPPIAKYVGQANVAGGHQQVNNDTRAAEDRKTPSELLEQVHGERLDFGAEATPERIDSGVETMGAIHGAGNL